MTCLPLIGLAILLTAVSVEDWRRFRIPNRLVMGVAALALLEAWATGREPGWIGAAAVFAAMTVLYACGIMGGGDVKLMSACALLFPQNLPGFLFFTSCAGGLLACGWLGLGLARGLKVRRVPYGAAIGAGALTQLGLNFFKGLAAG
ncbi:MAG: prepilin peptidase [Candidatus Adiutrix sp.]|jgi:prepilin peptidase CpaA|nr:prepilin peptidase [Candidatus Adiutrix sp.]